MPTFLSGCALPYYWQAATGQLELLSSRIPISEALEDPEQTEATRSALARAVEIREYAVVSLGLPDNDSYRSFVDLGRPYVVWNVVAAEEFSVDPVDWCFPIAGCVTYRGYFEEDSAQRFAADLRTQGFETYIGGVSAYSTLGYFADPLLSSMLTGDEVYIAGIVFHELAHQRAYIKGDTAINEAFATVVAEFGTAQWLSQSGDLGVADGHSARRERRENFFALIARYQDRLRNLYSSDAPIEEKRALKSSTFANLLADYESLKGSWGGASDYDDWFSHPLNNAQLASVVAYSRWLPNFRAFLNGNGLEALYAEMEILEALSPEERESRLQDYL
ncbi:MAG: aminopeptidase, partial [Gammaproteobacteria bacterium]